MGNDFVHNSVSVQGVTEGEKWEEYEDKRA